MQLRFNYKKILACMMLIVLSSQAFSQSQRIYFSPNVGINDFILDKNDNIILATSSGAYRSTDEGKTWNPTTLMNESPMKLFVNDKGVIFTYDIRYGAYHSYDDGKSWVKINSKKLDIVVMGKDNVLWDCKDDILMQSMNFGKDWVNINSPKEVLCLWYLSINDDFYIRKKKLGGYVTNNQGKSWSYIEGLDKFEHVRFLGGANGSIYIFEEKKNGKRMYRIYKSHDKGKTWTDLKIIDKKNIGINFLGIINNDIYLSSRHGGIFKVKGIGYVMDIKKSIIPQKMWSGRIEKIKVDSKGNWYAISLYDIYKGSNNGKNWSSIKKGLPVSDGPSID